MLNKMADNIRDSNGASTNVSADTPLTFNLLLHSMKSKDFQDVVIATMTPMFMQESQKMTIYNLN